MSTDTDTTGNLLEMIGMDVKGFNGVIDNYDVHQKRTWIHTHCGELISLAKEEKRDLTDKEQAAFDQGMREIKLLDSHLAGVNYQHKDGPKTGLVPTGGNGGGGSKLQIFGRDEHGKDVYCLAKDQRFQDLPAEPGRPSADGISLGRILVAMVSHDWKHATQERKFLAALSTDSDLHGGFLVPIELSKILIDLARNKSKVLAAGAQTIPMSSDRLEIATLATDPSFSVVGENVAITESNPTFGQIGLTAVKIACLCKMSRELASDAPNMAQIIEETLAKALAVELDRIALVGSGSQEPNGLQNISGIGTTAVGGAITWEGLHGGVVALRALNHEPSGYIVHPTIAGDCDIIVSGDASNSAKLWLGPPPSLAGVTRHQSVNATTALAFIGDWSKFVFGLRQDPLVELTAEGGDSFEKHQVFLKITWRGDVQTTDATAFHLLTGITT